MSNETSGITHLNPEMLLPMDIDLPSSKNSCFKGLSQAKRLSWMIIIGNTLSAFTVGLTIAGAMHFALAEGIAVTIAFLMQERAFIGKCRFGISNTVLPNIHAVWTIRPCSLIRTINSTKDLIHRTGDYTLLLRNGMNPLQAFLAGTFSSGE